MLIWICKFRPGNKTIYVVFDEESEFSGLRMPKLCPGQVFQEKVPYKHLFVVFIFFLYNPRGGKNLTLLKIQRCFREVLGDVWRYLWTMFGDNCGAYLRGLGGNFERFSGSFREGC